MDPCSRRSHAFHCVLFVHLIGCNRVASVQSEPGHQNLLIQPPLGRKRGLRQVNITFPWVDKQAHGWVGGFITGPLFGSYVAPCCPSRKTNLVADLEHGSRRRAAASSPRTNRWVMCVRDCVCLVVKVSGSVCVCGCGWGCVGGGGTDVKRDS